MKIISCMPLEKKEPSKISLQIDAVSNKNQEQVCLDFSHKFLKFDLHGLSSRIPYPSNGK